MDINCYLDRDGGGLGDPIIKAFAKGHGGRLTRVKEGLIPGLPVFWGILRGNGELIRQAMLEKRMFLYIDHAYLRRGHDLKNYRVVVNNLQNTEPINWFMPSDRLDKLVCPPIEPWVAEHKERVLVCPPTDHIAKFFGVNANEWTEKVCQDIHQEKFLPLVRQKTSTRKLEEDFSLVRAVVTFNSSVAIKALQCGIPVYTSEHSAARRMGFGIEHLYTLVRPPTPERRIEYFRWLAYKQFHISEMEAGTVLAAISK